MSKAPSFPFYPRDHSDDPELKLVSVSTRGIWMELVCHMWWVKNRGKISGTLEEFCMIARCLPSEMRKFFDEQKLHKFCTVTFYESGQVTVECRRMVRTEKARLKKNLRQDRYRARQQCDGESDAPETKMCIVPSSFDEKEKEKKMLFVKPTLKEVTDYCRERGNNVDPQMWFDFYESKGFMIGKNKMRSWQAAVRTWEKNENNCNPRATTVRQQQHSDMDKLLNAVREDDAKTADGTKRIDKVGRALPGVGTSAGNPGNN